MGVAVYQPLYDQHWIYHSSWPGVEGPTKFFNSLIILGGEERFSKLYLLGRLPFSTSLLIDLLFFFSFFFLLRFCVTGNIHPLQEWWSSKASLLHSNLWLCLCSVCLWNTAFISFENLAWIFDFFQLDIHLYGIRALYQGWYVLFQMYSHFS